MKAPASAGVAVADASTSSLRDPRIPLPGLFARGLAMGVAEAVPGVSGGTVAFVSGIYDELVKSLASFSHRSLPTLRRQGWRTFAAQHNLGFFLVLGAGMATSFLLVALLIKELLETHGIYLSGLFFGLIFGSVIHIGSQTPWRGLATAGLVGLALGLAMGILFADHEATAGSVGLTGIFCAGALAATAWMLPGVSGAFVLLLLGLYEPLLLALAAGDLAIVATFAGGLALGMLMFSKLLGWLLSVARTPVIALLTGFMAGSLTLLWPWRDHALDWSTATLGVVATIAAGIAIIGLLALVMRHRERSAAAL